MAVTKQRSIRWNWILDGRTDLTWYVGSALVGWLFVAVILLLGRGLADPLHDPFFTLNLEGSRIDLTLYLMVFASWAFLLDSPHLWATLARTYLDPEQWARRRRELTLSLGWFAVGPVAVLAPYWLGALVPLAPQQMALGENLFFLFFRLWAYYHVVRQHWGFLALYRRKNEDPRDLMEGRADSWFFLPFPVLTLRHFPFFALVRKH